MQQGSEELAQSVSSCTQLQWVISRLLEASKHPDLVTEMHVLQDIDRLQQTLADLACLFERLAESGADVPVCSDTARNAMRLDSLKERIFGAPESAEEDGASKCDVSDITWL